MSASENMNPELQQFQRADDIINQATLAYEAEQSKNAMLKAQVRQDAAQKFAKDTPLIIKEVSDKYKSYLSRTGEHPNVIDTRCESRLSMYSNPIVTPKGALIGKFNFREMYDIYTAESQKACSNTGEILRQLGFKITGAQYLRYGEIDYIDSTAREEPKYQHGCKFIFAAEELNKKR